jgi:hypothetical protein
LIFKLLSRLLPTEAELALTLFGVSDPALIDEIVKAMLDEYIELDFG